MGSQRLMYKLVLIALFIGSLVASTAVQAQDSEYDSEILLLSRQIDATPNDGRLLIARARRYDSLGEYQFAVRDMKLNCNLETDLHVRELCFSEVKEYNEEHSLP